MERHKPVYVIDTNVLIDYEEIIPAIDEPSRPVEKPTVDLSAAHLVVPSVVIRELSKFKNETSQRGKTARNVLRRLRNIFEVADDHSMRDFYTLLAPVQIGEQYFSILPVHKNFTKTLAFDPSETDMNGQIILTALSAESILNGKPLTGDSHMPWMSTDEHNVILLTNDNGLAIRARERGLRTMRYGHKSPEPYTGRREIYVTDDIYNEFIGSRRLDRKLLEEYLPGQPPLVANEFVVMLPPGGGKFADDGYFSYIGRYDAREDAILPLEYALSFPVWPRNPGQAIYAEALMNPDISAVICTGPAGSGKTYMATIYGYKACQDGQFIGVTVVPCESRSNLGALPGDLDEKMDPDIQPLKNALRNYLLHEDSALKKELATLQKYGALQKDASHGKKHEEDAESCGKRSLKTKLADRVDLIWDNWFSSIPIENARGRDFAYELAIYDEFQDQNAAQADTLIKRLGMDGKIILTGDIHQIHNPYLDPFNNGLTYASRLLFNHPMVAQVHFTEDEIIRHPLVQFVAELQAETPSPID